MKRTGKREDDRNSLTDLNDEVIRLKGQLESGLERYGSREVEVDGKKMTISQASIFEEIDELGDLKSSIDNADFADSALIASASSLGKIGEELNNPDIASSDRKALQPHIETARKQLQLSSSVSLDEDQQQEYDNAYAKIEKQIKMFEVFIKNGIKDESVVKEIVKERSEKLKGWAGGIFTAHPLIGYGVEKYKEYKDKKEQHAKDAQASFESTTREQLSSLKQKKDEKLKDSEPAVIPKPSKTKSTPTKSAPAPKIDIKAPASTPVSSSSESIDVSILHSDMQQIIAINTGMVEILKEIEKETEKQRVFAERADSTSDEERVEAERKTRKGGLIGAAKGKLGGLAEDGKEMFGGVVTTLSDVGRIFKGVGKGGLKGLKMIGGLMAGIIPMITGIVKMLMGFAPKLLVLGKGLSIAFKIFTKIFAIPLAVIGGIWNAVSSWGEGEGKDLPGKILDAIVDFASGAFSALTFGLLDSDTISKAFKDFGKWVYGFIDSAVQWAKDAIMQWVPDWMKSDDEPTKSTGTVQDTIKRTEQDSAGAIKVSDTGKVSVIDKDELEKVSASRLGVLMKHGDLTDEDYKFVKKLYEKKKSGGKTAEPEPMYRSPNDYSESGTATPEKSTGKQGVRNETVGSTTSKDRVTGSGAGSPTQVNQDNKTINNNTSVVNSRPEAGKTTSRNDLAFI